MSHQKFFVSPPRLRGVGRKNAAQSNRGDLERVLKEEHTAVRKRGREGNFSWIKKLSGGIGWDSLVELVCPVISEKTATDIINFFSQENSEKVAL